MSTGSDHSDRYENSPLGHQYVIRLHSKEEICLHALSILQADLLPCYLPAYLSEDETELIIDSNGSIPLSELKGKDKAFVEKNYRKLLTSFLSDLIRSLDHSLSLSGICYLEEKLFYNRITKRIVCIYLPLKSRLLKRTVLLSKLDESALDELLHVLGLEERRSHLPSQLSGGQQQRVAIGRALFPRPALILADEPTGNLDSGNSREVIRLLKETSQKYSQTILMITHNRAIAQSAERVLRVSDGVLTDLGRCT